MSGVNMKKFSEANNNYVEKSLDSWELDNFLPTLESAASSALRSPFDVLSSCDGFMAKPSGNTRRCLHVGLFYQSAEEPNFSPITTYSLTFRTIQSLDIPNCSVFKGQPVLAVKRLYLWLRPFEHSIRVG
ncbi:unnamed protein product [Sphenostylis stenocarpa]|uniref:Uncharacterized protein n=1 Tax=Sphenostylis stenocarpa TaxID=92480 RepID=A0AA86S1L1_9FABA|nr:unnamed protein product [Sphenostylis stenocarpa]